MIKQMTELYPIKFEPVLKDKIWGGNSLVRKYGKKADLSRSIGESWEISAIQDNLSIISNGFLAGNNIEFPLLIKFIEAKQDLSVQVHPDDKLARERHKAYGKTEMWYILDNEPSSKIYTGFTHPVTREIFNNALLEGKLLSLLNIENSEGGDAFFTPAGRIHAIGAGNVLVEIQQNFRLEQERNKRKIKGSPY
jgi:mannose-6-phosphate isomerase